MYFLIGLALLFLVLLITEIRVRKPDELVLKDSSGQIKIRSFRYYPRHFSLVLPSTIATATIQVISEARGKIPVRISVVATVIPSIGHIDRLIRVGGWNKNAVIKALKEFEIVLQARVHELCEKFEIEELKSEAVAKHLREKAGSEMKEFGLEMLTINVSSLEPVDEKIVQAMQQRETARIIESGEKANQDARVSVAKHRIAADEKIAQAEHELEMKKYTLKRKTEAENAQIANMRVKEELERRNMQLDYDRKEMDLLKSNPELILLTPQIARLAEASQNLRNAKTVVNLAGSDGIQGPQISNLLNTLLQNLTSNVKTNSRKTSSKK